MRASKKRKLYARSKETLGRIFNNLFFLVFLNGFLLATVFYLYIESSYESDLFRNIVHNVYSEIPVNAPQDSFLVKSMHIAHDLLAKRENIFAHSEFTDIKARILRPATVELATASGACGSFAIVLARILRAADVRVRIGQMKVNGVFGGHMFVEAKSKDKWVVLDPMFNTYFVRPDGGLASFADVSNDWEYYKLQVPEGYNVDYNYSGVRYTNWNKIPLLSPAIKKLLDLTLGKEKADGISIRPYFLRVYNIALLIALIIFIPIFLHTCIVLYRRKKYVDPLTGTFSSEFKYLKKPAGARL